MICLNKIPLFNELCFIYTAGICHKKFILFLNPKNCKVDVFDHCLKKIASISTEKYCSITENKEDCYFILTKENERDYLYKSTYDFLEFDSIKLQVPNKYKESINDIFYDTKEKLIIIVTDNFIYAVTLEGYFVKELVGGAVLTSNAIVKSLNGCCMQTNNQQKSSLEYTAIGFCNSIYVTYNEKENTYLAVMNEAHCLSEPICLGKNIRVVSIFTCCGKLNLLVIKNNHYNYLYVTDIDCEECHQEKCLPCKCHEEDHHCHKHCNDTVACLLESVALVETSLSHILNAEGEKIQKAIADDVDVCQLLEVNNSVTESIFNVTMLEHVLQKKMEKALQYDKCHRQCDKCHKHCDDC